MIKQLLCLIGVFLLIGFIESVMVYFFLISAQMSKEIAAIAFIILFIIWAYIFYLNAPDRIR